MTCLPQGVCGQRSGHLSCPGLRVAGCTLAFGVWWVRTAVARVARTRCAAVVRGGVIVRVAAPPRRGPGRCRRAAGTPPGQSWRAGGKQEAGWGGG